MSAKQTNDEKQYHLLCYEIHLEGHLDDRWAEWFEGMAITRDENGNTLLSGPVADQAALHGLLKKVRDVGMPLIAVNRIKADHPDAPDIKHSISSVQ